jgi:hypothetical protein
MTKLNSYTDSVSIIFSNKIVETGISPSTF